MPKETKEILSFDFANLNQAVQTLLTYRLALYNAEKEQMITIPVVIPVIVILIVPEIFVLIGVLAVIAVFLGISAKFIKLDAAKQDNSAEEEKLVKVQESLKEKPVPKDLDVQREDYDETPAEDSLADRA
jgi:hypothetical protein